MNAKESARSIRCIDCVHCDVEDMKCYPDSEDCESEYNLTTEDINQYSNARCDFYKKKA